MTPVVLPRCELDSVVAGAVDAALVLCGREPAPGERDVPLHAAFAFSVLGLRAEQADVATLDVWLDGVPLFIAGVPSEPVDPGTVAVTEEPHRLDVRWRLKRSLTSDFEHQLRVRVAAHSGTVLDEEWAFRAEDRIAPVLIAGTWRGTRSVVVEASEPLAAGEGSWAVEPLGRPAFSPVVRDVHHLEDGLIQLDLDDDVSSGVGYRVRAHDVRDLAGNVVDPAHASVLLPARSAGGPLSRRFSLWEMLPLFNRRQDLTGDLRGFIACLQDVLDLQLADVDRFVDLVDLDRAPSAFVEAMLRDLGNPFAFELDDRAARRLASVLIAMYQQKGTAVGIRNAVRFFVGLEVEAITPFAADALVLGESEIGVDWILGPDGRFARYAFDVRVSRRLTASERHQLRQIIDYLKPAHTHFVDLVEPSLPIFIDHWELGVSELGTESVLH